MSKNFLKLNIFAIAFILVFASLNQTYSQRVVVEPPAPPKPMRTPKPSPRAVPEPPVVFERSENSEKSIFVESKINVSICVMEGNVKINGWDRNEVRVFVKNGSQVGFKTLQKNRQSGKPEWIMLTSEDVENRRQISECIFGNEIEIDVPRNASIVLKGQETTTKIDSVRKAVVKNIGGDIFMRNISEGVEALTYEGDVTVENSSGAMNLDSASGNIVAFEVSPSEIGDIFKAKTNNGAIVLNGIGHRQSEVYSISGSIGFNGEFLSGGSYNFGTSNGAIVLTIPQNSSCKIIASYGFGGFSSEMPMNKITENKTPRSQNIVGIMGSGDSTLNLTTISGAIRLRKVKN